MLYSQLFPRIGLAVFIALVFTYVVARSGTLSAMEITRAAAAAAGGGGGGGGYSTPTNFAAIIDDRADPRLVPLILHFSSVLGSHWPIVLFTSPGFTTTSAAFNRKIKDGSIRIKEIPGNVDFGNHRAVSAFLTKPWIWEQLAPASHVLFFQLDSIICSNSPLAIEDFLQYDLVGAPIKPEPGWGMGYNGGLSLRNRRLVLDVIRDNDWAEEVRQAELKGEDGIKLDLKGPVDPAVIFPGNPNGPRIQYEDQWFFRKFAELPTRDGQPAARLPHVDVARTFAVESLNYRTPFAYHKPGSMFPEDKEHLDRYCPEYVLATAKGFATPD